jgi:hypothetical protein
MGRPQPQGPWIEVSSSLEELDHVGNDLLGGSDGWI